MPTPVATPILSLNYSFTVLHNEPHLLETKVLRFSPWFFNTLSYAAQQGGQNLLTYLLCDASTCTQVYAMLHLYGEQNDLKSPRRAPFGSVEVAEGISYKVLNEWLDQVMEDCRGRGYAKIVIKHFPECYAPQRAVFVRRALLRSGFLVRHSFENQHIELTGQSFETQLHPSERRRLRKCMHAGFRCEQWDNPDVGQVYDYIATNRQRLGYALSFTLEDLQRWMALFPEKYLVFCVRDGVQIAALTVAVWVGEQVMYNFCPVNAPEYKAFSPAVLLTAGLYEFCQQRGISTLDLGISIDDTGQPKPSLQRFKRNLGAVISVKMIFEKSLQI